MAQEFSPRTSRRKRGRKPKPFSLSATEALSLLPSLLLPIQAVVYDAEDGCWVYLPNVHLRHNEECDCYEFDVWRAPHS